MSPVALRHTELHLARIERLVELRLEAGGLDAPPGASDRDDPALLALEDELARFEDTLDAPPPLALLSERFSLAPLERDTLVLVVAMELHERCSRLVAALRGGSRHGFVDPQLALALFASRPVAEARLLDEGAILFRAGLLRAVPVRGFAPYRASACLVPEPHLLAFLAGRRELGRDLDEVALRVVPEVEADELPGLAPTIDALAQVLRGFLHRPVGGPPDRLGSDRALVVSLSGPPGSGRRLAVQAAARRARRAVIELDGALLAGHEAWVVRLRQALTQAELYGELVHLRYGDVLFERQPGAPAVLRDLARRHTAALVLSHAAALAAGAFDESVVLRARTPSVLAAPTAEALWRSSLPPDVTCDDSAALARLATTEALAPARIRQAARLATLREAADHPPGAPLTLTAAALSAAAHLQRETGLGELTSPESPHAAGQAAELVLSPKNVDEIASITRACASRSRVMQTWGFERILRRGTGIICLFDGPPGTGKTLTAEVIARELALELHQINVARIVDKYIGETEKNLERVFARIVPERTLLLFDEADSLFGSRVKVSTSTDRYANMAINTLLQLIERYPGVVVLTTNLKDAIDPAFERRITYKVIFDKPDADARAQLWRAHLPPEAPLAPDVDLDALADTFELSGGHIKNAVLRAALDCAHGGRLTQAALYAQAVREASSLGMVVRRSAFD